MVQNESRLHWNYKSCWGKTHGSYGSRLCSLAQSDLIANQNLFRCLTLFHYPVANTYSKFLTSGWRLFTCWQCYGHRHSLRKVRNTSTRWLCLWSNNLAKILFLTAFGQSHYIVLVIRIYLYLRWCISFLATGDEWDPDNDPAWVNDC